MIILGTTVLNFKKDEGEFFCPVCHEQREYKQKIARQFFTVYFIPLIPLNVVGEFVQCTQCRQKYDNQILTYDPEAERQELFDAYSRLMVLLMLNTGRVGENHRDQLRQALMTRFDTSITDETVMELAQEAEEKDAEPLAYAHRFRRSYSPDVCFDVLQVAVHTLRSDEPFSEADRKLLESTTEAFGLPPEALTTALAGETSDLEPRSSSDQL